MRSFTAALLLFTTVISNAQTNNVWTLQKSVQYALDHNITIQQDVLNARLAKFALLQSQLAQLPSLNASGSYGKSYGRSVDPTSNQFINTDYTSVGVSASSNVLLFGWFQQRNNISKNKYNLRASEADLDQLKNDVSLNVATGYLRALLAKEQIKVSEKQVELSKAQYLQTKEFYEAGRLPELNVAQLESQLATDSANLITAIATYSSAILDLKALLNLDFPVPMEIVAPDVKLDDAANMTLMSPEQIYQEAKKHFGSIRAAEYRVGAAKKSINIATALLLPQLSFGAQFGSNWSSSYQQISGYKPNDTINTGAFITDGISYLPVYQVITSPIYSEVPLGTQLNNNFRQTYGITLSIPIFNGWQDQFNLKQAKYNLATQQLNQYQADLTLKQNVYKSYNDAINSVQKYNAALHASIAADRAQEFAKKRYDLGLTSTVDYLVTQNARFSAASSLLSAKYDLIFKLKVIDYYLGKELKL